LGGTRNCRTPVTSFILTISLFIALPSSSAIRDATQLQKPLQHEVTIVNIAVPTRVFDGDKFVNNLTANDFIVLENGVIQKVEAAYLIRKTSVLQNAVVVGSSVPVPVPVEKPDESLKRRHFVLIFEMDEYLPQLTQAIELFFNDVLTQDDTLRIITPENVWEIKKGPLTKESRAKMADDLKSKLRKSLTLSSSQLRRLIMDIRIMSENQKNDEESGGLYFLNTMAIGDAFEQIVNMKTMDIPQYEKFARFPKPLDGQKNVIIFYQKESYVFPNRYRKIYEDVLLLRQNMSGASLDALKKIFADSESTVHFLFMTKTKAFEDSIEYRDRLDAMTVEKGEDFYATFRNLAIATGGISLASANPIYGFKRALDASENYYLVYYAPAEYKANGKYKEIEVKVKSGRYRVDHRAGYIDK
jgi:hypothetical protein